MSAPDRKWLGADLREGHLRRIATTLTLLDRATCEFEQWTGGREVDSVLYKETNSLGPDQRERIGRQVAAIRACLERLKADLRLQPSCRDVASAMRARCATVWEALVELEPKRLERYGPLPADAAQRIDTSVTELLDLLETISRSISQ